MKRFISGLIVAVLFCVPLVAAEESNSHVPPGIQKQGHEPKGLEKKEKTPHGWIRGKSWWKRGDQTPRALHEESHQKGHSGMIEEHLDHSNSGHGHGHH